MSAIRLDTPFLDGGVRSTSYFNGRILSREDMQRDKDAERAIDERLGRALGAGVVRGLEVEARAIGGSSVTEPVVTVRAGLALNRLGQTVALARDVDVALLRPQAPPAPGSPVAGSFNVCAPPTTTVYVVGTGVYLLAAAPAQARQGLALVSGLGNQGASCNAKEVVDGIQFHLFQMTTLTNAELADDAHLRNVAAYKHLGAGVEAVDPFGAPPAAPALTDPPLTDCDVPLALFQWTNTGGLRWVDRWAVRRRVAAPSPLGADGRWPVFDTERRSAAGMAMVLQLLDHLADLRATAGGGLKATDHFTRLPPLGLLPVPGGGHGGHDLAAFFTGLKRGPVPAHIEAAKLPALFADATLHPPIELGSHETIWTYFVHENIRAVDTGAPAQPYLVFTNGQMAYRGDARFDLAYWNYANYALACG